MRKNTFLATVELLSLVLILPTAIAAAEPQPTNQHLRIVWCQQAEGDGSDAFAKGNQLRLMGWDNTDSRGEHPILANLTNYHKPLLSPKGDRILFSDLAENRTYCVNWDGSDLHFLFTGLVADVWIDPTNQTEWAYLIACGKGEAFCGKPIYRCQLDNPNIWEFVWKIPTVSLDNFQLSADGHYASGLFPWPKGGLADLTKQTWTLFGKGCWTSLAPDNSYRLWIFDGAHRQLIMNDTSMQHRHLVPINTAPGIDGYEVYHPRWSNNSRYFVITGPYKGGEGANRIGAGGTNVEIYIGQFNDDFTQVAAWQRVTTNSYADFYPDLWVEPSASSNAAAATTSPGPLPAPTTNEPTGTNQAPAQKFHTTVKAKLIFKSATPSLASIAPYRQALVVYTYLTQKIIAGENPGERILVAHWAIVNGKTKPDTKTIGHVYPLKLELYTDHPELEGERLIMDSNDYDLPLYYEIGN